MRWRWTPTADMRSQDMNIMDQTPDIADQTGPVLMSRGLKFPRDPQYLTGRTRRALKIERYEYRETQAVLKLIREGDVVIELGAGIGYMSTVLSRLTGAAHIHSFEANPNLIPYIHRVHAANDVTNATVENALLGPRKGTATFHVRQNFLSSSLDEMDGSGIVARETIPVLNVNTVMKQIKPTVLVCDIEGAEVDLIPAMDLSGLRAAVIELHPQWIKREGVAAVFNAMMAAGLVYFPRWSDSKVVCFRSDW
jgi:FkbM family methyltransferase